ncbi:unnamed protein product [Heligmosomoides polygyrus]|uniref:Oligomycin sensitivity conferral protein n=1 Tax=Heligmosomoides polygyrus TaxID=6339 RepID=A0A183GVV2_HELPZ|nr:unnamed protein product [Heligmosomoides polygyrus]
MFYWFTQVHGIEGRYASALYTAAFKQKSLDQVDKDLQKIVALYREEPKFKEFVLNPTLKGSKKKIVMQAIAQKLALSKESINFLGLLAENRRLGRLEAVVGSFESIMSAHKGELFVQVTSAEPLTKSHQAALSDALHKVGVPLLLFSSPLLTSLNASS